ncbi:MAG: CocE/NonD family hydrolase [Pyrinomonadaceae bacterium]|nr:CocE/NonD family hydrolase [Pyrinomonadaceae bacterium]
MNLSGFMRARVYCLVLVAAFWTTAVQAVHALDDAEVKAHYLKSEQMITMRDGVRLFTSIYVPKDTSKKYPIMLSRTPYSVAPYGPDSYKTALGPSPLFQNEGFIFVYQDVRGRLMSEGEYVNVRPHKPQKASARDIDESTDTYDTIDWLVKNVPNNNGRVGTWGISYPGFYVSTGIIDAHPALKAASPQAPIADWFIGDDFHHNGALFLPHTFNFFSSFGLPRPKPTIERPPSFQHGTPDGYRFFLEMGPLSNADKKYLKGQVAFWNEAMNHPNYDEFWKARNIRPHFKNIKPAVMTVGGWFDAEDLFGALNTYKSIEQANPGANSTLVMGPWFHGGWSRSDGDSLGSATFGSKTSVYYRENVELPFFNCLLKDKCDRKLPEALVFETGSNQWRMYDQWPVTNVEKKSLYLQSDGRLSFDPPADRSPGKSDGFDEYISDPNKPAPYINGIAINMTVEYMVDDQRFAATRPDVLVYETPLLQQNVTIAGPITATLYVSTSGTDSDYVVKVIDVFPNDSPDPEPSPTDVKMGGYQMLVRGEPMRARFRNSFEKPEAMVPNKVTKIEFTMPDVNHSFLKGHKIMVQIQSTWFPLVDRNPQKFVDIYKATEADFQKATQRIYRSGPYRSQLIVNVLK